MSQKPSDTQLPKTGQLVLTGYKRVFCRVGKSCFYGLEHNYQRHTQSNKYQPLCDFDFRRVKATSGGQLIELTVTDQYPGDAEYRVPKNYNWTEAPFILSNFHEPPPSQEL